MQDYNFSTLNDKEFEALALDLLSASFDTPIERFKPGRDQGIDGRFFCAQNDSAIIQCKHYIGSGTSKLVSDLKKKELPKVKKLNPSRYIVVTSVGLTPQNKENILSTFAPYLLSEGDIFGRDDVNALIRQFSYIEQNHYKLWLSSTTILKNIVNIAIIGRSKFHISEIKEGTKRYVRTASHDIAMEKLNTLHTVIITGGPGVGKTTLADQLCLNLAGNGFELCYIASSIVEAEAHYQRDKMQAFYFDDFLGSNYLLALEKREDSIIVDFMKRVHNDPNKRFILTSRSHILNQGKRLGAQFEAKGISRNEHQVSVSNLTRTEKATILYNHLFFGDLDSAYIDEIYKDKRYRKIVGHPNFNPRLIDFITSSIRLDSVNKNQYWDYITQNLDNPESIWGHVFDMQLDNITRIVVIGIVLEGRVINQDSLELFYYKVMNSELVDTENRTFLTTIKLLVGALINRLVDQKENVVYSLYDPSIADYVLNQYMGNIQYVANIVECLDSSNAIRNLRSQFRAGNISKSQAQEFVDILLAKHVKLADSHELSDYLLALILFFSELEISIDKYRDFLAKVATNASQAKRTSCDEWFINFIEWAIRVELLESSDEGLADEVYNWIGFNYYYFQDYYAISNLVTLLDTEHIDLHEKFRKEFKDFAWYEITGEVSSELDLEDILEPEDLNIREVRSHIESMLNKMLILFEDEDVDELVGYFDVDELVESNREAVSYQNKNQHQLSLRSSSSEFSQDEIDDVFERG